MSFCHIKDKPLLTNLAYNRVNINGVSFMASANLSLGLIVFISLKHTGGKLISHKYLFPCILICSEPKKGGKSAETTPGYS